MSRSIKIVVNVRVFIISILAVLCFSVKNGIAQTFNFETSEMSEILKGNDLYTHGFSDTITIRCAEWDNIMPNISSWRNDFKLKSNQSYIKFYVDNYSQVTKYMTPVSYDYRAVVDVYGFTSVASYSDTVNVYTLTPDTLTISYNNYDDNTPYQDMSLRKYSNYYKMYVIVHDILRDSSGTFVTALPQMADTVYRNFNFEGSILTQRYDKIEYGIGSGSTLPVITNTPHPGDNYIDVNWNFASGTVTPVNYQLEWTYVDDYGVSIASGTETPIPSSSLVFNFEHNSTKVWLNTNSYKIPIVYPRGYIVYRVRSVRPDSTFYKDPVYGDWTIGGAGSIGSLSSSDFYYISTPYMKDQMNWQYTVSFAEGGKYKNVVSFFDGLLKNRQSITRFNSILDKIIATNNIYDFEGHLCIKTLPAPIKSSAFEYQQDVDLNSVTGLPYVADDFDTGAGSYTLLPPMAAGAYASVYYSNSNSDTTTTTYQKYVPDAQGYPLVQTIYEPGFNDRIAAQGGAGPKLQIGDSNYVRNMYVSALQPTLNSLFGPNVGWNKFYTMTVSRDPNQQYSMVINDYEGKQMVSALIGNGPDTATHAIRTMNVPPPQYVKTDLLQPEELCQQVDTVEGTRVASVNFFNENQGADSLEYYYNLPPYEPCPGQYVSVASHLDLWLTDQYGNVLLSKDTVIGTNHVDVANTPTTYTIPPTSFSADIAPYHVNKTLSFHSSDIEAALDSFFNVANCFLTEPYFIKQSVKSETFPCPSTEMHDSDECAKLRWDMMQQLFPQAAYGKYTVIATDSVLGTGNSIFDIQGCKVDTFSVPRYYLDSQFVYCYNPYAVVGADSMRIIYDHPTLGPYGYRCFCTDIYFPSRCDTDTVFTTSVTISAIDLNPLTRSIYVPFVPALGGMTGNYFINTTVDLSSIGTGISLGSSTVGNISQHPGILHDTTFITLPLSVSGDNFYANLRTVIGADSFIFEFSGIMAPTHIDSMHHYIDSFFVDSLAPNYSSPLCHYRYQDTCTIPSLQDTITVAGVFYANLRSMPGNEFIRLYRGAIAEGNYSIAEALLPLHPQYCELNNCFIDTFRKQLEALPDWQTAESLNMFYLDSLVAHDPIVSIMAGSGIYPFPEDSLRTYRGGTIRLDSLVFIGAYCGCVDTAMFDQCLTGAFANEIANHLLINSTVKSFYYDKIQSIYIANRQRFVDAVYMKDGTSCYHCADARMQFDPATPVLPAYYANDTTLLIYPGGVPSSWVGSVMTDSLEHVRDSSGAYYASTDSAFAFGFIDTVMSHLSNCIAGNSSVEANVRADLENLYNTGQAPHGNYSYGQIRKVLQNNGITLDDLCNPYIFNFSRIGMMPWENKCRSQGFYDGLAAFLNSPAVTGVLHSGTPFSNYLLDNSNLAESEIALAIGGHNNADISGSYNSTTGVYTITINVNSLLPFSGTMNIYLHEQGCSGIYGASSPGSVITGVDCINSSPLMATAPGFINQYGFVASVTPVSGGGLPCFLTGWMDSVLTTVNVDEPLAECIPCTDMRTLYTKFTDTLLAYGIKGTDHPYYSVMLTNFMNAALEQQYTAYDYDAFVHSCAIADSMLIPLYTGYATYKFSNAVDAAAFAAALAAIDPDYNFNTLYCDLNMAADTFTIFVDLNIVPRDILWKYRDYLNSPVSSIDHQVNARFSAAHPEKIGVIYCDPASPFSPGDSSIINTPPVSFVGPYQKQLYITGSFQTRDFYDVVAQPGTPPYEVSEDVYKISTYLYEHSIAGAVFMPFYKHTVNHDYFKPEKKALLSYIYSHQGQLDHDVLRAMQTQNLAANIGSYSPYTPYYSREVLGDIMPNLYLWNASMNGRYHDTLQKIIDLADPLSGGAIFNTVNHISVPLSAPAELDDYVCGDGAYWYRYFTTSDTMFNVFLAFPEYIPKWLRPSYRVAGPVIAMPGDSLNRYFGLPVVRTGTTDTLTLFGLSTFVIGKSIELDNVLLRRAPRPAISESDTFNNCERQTLTSAINTGMVNYRNYIDSVKQNIGGELKSYVAAKAREQLMIGSFTNGHYYTLYNYDRAGNLAFTVTPAGNIPIPNTGNLLATVDTARKYNTPGTAPTPTYTKINNYNYSSMNQVVTQETINGGKTRFFYDAASRLVFSQNARQATKGSYTYNIYDEQSRIVETGEIDLGCPYFAPYIATGAITQTCYTAIQSNAGTLVSPDPTLVTFLDNKPLDSVRLTIRRHDRRDVVVTIYDTVATNLGLAKDMSAQQNLRKRISCVKYFTQLLAPDSAFVNYSNASHYSYDILGNVQTLTQDYPMLATLHHQFIRIDYDYDVISGKVNMLSYNRGGPDQFYQRYRYDDDNRILAVSTSADGLTWKRDARYFYYDHGPLARTEYGDLRIQGVDYAYTIQGWLKAANGDTVNADMDMGTDGATGSIRSPDVVAHTIDYFKDDYQSITTRPVQHVAPTIKSLYNGNIVRQTSAIDTFLKLNKQYGYDQNNRIIAAGYAAVDPVTSTLNGLNDFQSRYSYDPDGNLQTLVRYGNNTGTGALLMDSLHYWYPTGPVTDRLVDVHDSAANHYALDLQQHTGSPRYTYDEIGNITKDLVSGQDTVQWNLYNKVTKTRNDADTSSMEFMYDAMGNRVMKAYFKTSVTSAREKADVYVRDAQGNILAVYELKSEVAVGATPVQYVSYALAEHDLYGSSRIGIKKYFGTQVGLSADVLTGIWDTSRFFCHLPWYSLEYQDMIKVDSVNLYGNTMNLPYYAQHILGQKEYELTDHLGNVLATVSDKRTGRGFTGGPLVAGTVGSITGYKAQVVSAHDYYPFGSYMPGRYASDTSAHCVTTTLTSTTASTYSVTTTWVAINGTGALLKTHSAPFVNVTNLGGGNLGLTTFGGINRGISWSIPLISTAAPGLNISLGATVGPHMIEVTDNVTSALIGSLPFSTSGASVVFVPFTTVPHSNSLTIAITNTSTLGVSTILRNITVARDTILSHSTVATVCSDDGYRFGYNGQMKVNEWAGLGNHYQYRFREYDPRTARFISVDPLAKSYPWNGAYNFAEDRVIDGLDLEGKEYYSVHINEAPDGTRTKVAVINYTNVAQKGATNIETAKGYGPQGDVGVNYTITKVDANGKTVSRTGFNVKNNVYGVYAGSNNPKAYWKKPDPKTGQYPDDYSLPPIDETDASAKQHDLDYDNAAPGGLHGFLGVMDDRSSKANNDFISRAAKIDEKQKTGGKDAVTGKPVTKKAAEAGNRAAKGFQAAESLKHYTPPQGPKE